MHSLVLGLFVAASAALVGTAHANDYTLQYEITITNVTRGQSFTPRLLVTHRKHISLFDLGEPASTELEMLAEGGNTTPLADKLLGHPYSVADVLTDPGLLGPGESTMIIVEASRRHRYLSVAAMLIPTNDTFMALNGVRLPLRGSARHMAMGFDAGTEANDQNCVNIPGPRCMGAGYSPGPNDGDEGYVYVGNGFHSLPDSVAGEVLGPLVYGWNNAVAEIVIRRLH
jgi:hypothetical protein